MTQMFGQTCCIWNHAKNKFDLKVYNPPIILLSTVQMFPQIPKCFYKISFLFGTLICSF